MAFPDKIQRALERYNQRKGFLRRLWGDHPAIKALRNLPEAKQNNLLELYRCFFENLPKEGHLSDSVFWAVFYEMGYQRNFKPVGIILGSSGDYKAVITNVLALLIKANLTTQKNSDVIKARISNAYLEESRSSLEKFYTTLHLLSHSGLLTQENFDAIETLNNPSFVKVLSVLNHAQFLLTQEQFNIVKVHNNLINFYFTLLLLNKAKLLTKENFDRLLHEDNHFLCTSHASRIIWGRIPFHLLTQAVVDQLVTLAQGENPEQQIMQYVDRLLGVNRNTPGINGAQSTHTASVHQSVSDSATKLFNRYGQVIEGSRLKITLRIIDDYITGLPDGSERNKAAKRCIKNITKPTNRFADPRSQLTTQQLLALTFLALHDGENRVGGSLDVMKRFVEGLYEIQRGYNLETGVDDGGPDKPICASGAFNKLVEALESMHPDVTIIRITKKIASLKFPVVVREEAMRYLAAFANPTTAEALHTFTRLMAQVKKDGVEVIWDHIKDNIAQRIFDEFGSLYRDITDPSFTDLIEAGQYVELGDLSIFQEQVQNSKGYHQYCSQVLIPYSAGFFSARKAAEEYLSDHRHSSAAAQQEYDRHFGIVPRK